MCNEWLHGWKTIACERKEIQRKGEGSRGQTNLTRHIFVLLLLLENPFPPLHGSWGSVQGYQ